VTPCNLLVAEGDHAKAGVFMIAGWRPTRTGLQRNVAPLCSTAHQLLRDRSEVAGSLAELVALS
jgi:hypothetical protein